MEIVDYNRTTMNIGILSALDKRDCSVGCMSSSFSVEYKNAGVYYIELIEFSIFNMGSQLLTSNLDN